MPNALHLMAKAAQDAGISTSGTVKEMLKLQQEGKLTSSVVLPHFAKQLRSAASANGALKEALKSNRVSMNQMITSAQMAADLIFKSGWAEGLSDIFKATAEMLKENEALWISLGKIIGKVFSGIAWVIKNVIAPVVSAFGSILNGIVEILEGVGYWLSAAFAPLIRFMPVLSRIIGMFGGFKVVLGGLIAVAAKFALPFIAVLGILEEIAEFFAPTGKKTLLGTNVNTIKQDFKDLVDPFGAGKRGHKITARDQAGLQSSPLGISYGAARPPIIVNTQLNVDGETVARHTMSTEAANTAMDARIAQRTYYNY